MGKKLLNAMLLTISFAVSGLLAAGEIILAENGKAKASIVIPEKCPGVIRLAARELADHLKLMTGAEFRIATKADKTLPAVIRLGGGETAGFKPDTYVIRASGNTIHIYGKDDPGSGLSLFDLNFDNQWKGTLTGVYRFLDRLGVRWFAPGEKHRYIPRKSSLDYPEGNVKETPFFADRQISHVWNFGKLPDAREYGGKDAGREMYLFLLRNGGSTRSMVNGCHSERALKLWQNKEWLAHPERHQMMPNGKRNPRYSCWTDPAVTELWKKAADAYFSGKSPKEIGLDLPRYLGSKWPHPFISPDEFMIDPMDNDDGNDGCCYCARCKAFRKKYPCPDDSEIHWKVLSQVAEYIAEKHPGKYISTLVYGSKNHMPKYVKVPRNIRVRLCISGPKEMTHPKRLKEGLDRVRAWAELLGKENLPLWTYQCACFARTMPGFADTYPQLTWQFIQKMRPITNGMYLENIHLTHTMRVADTYMFLRGMWDPDLDYEKTFDEFFEYYYGPAAGTVKALNLELQKKWIEVWKLTTPDDPDGSTPDIVNVDQKRLKIRQEGWSKVYTEEEMKKLYSLLEKAEKETASDPVYKARVALLRKWYLDVMLSERNEIMGKENIRKNIKLPVKTIAAKDGEFPSEEQWETAKANQLIPAVRMVETLKAPGQFKILASKDHFYVQGELTDSEIAKSATDPRHTAGCEDVWKDNCAELFFYAPEGKKFWQIVIADNGAWHSQTTSRRSAAPKWTMMPGFRVKAVKRSNGWSFVCAIPRKEVESGGELRFNFARERQLKKQKPELSTWSPLCLKGNWHFPENYGTIILK